MGDANKEASGKSVMMGAGAMGDTKERSLKIRGKGAEDSNNFRDWDDSILAFLSLGRAGCNLEKGNFFLRTKKQEPKMKNQ